MKYGFVIDNRKCIGCHACTTACKSEHEVPVGVNRTWVKQVEKGTFPNTRRVFSVMRCNHCTNAPCVTICPVEALYYRKDGIVDFDKDRCIGCKSCMQACPYDALYIDPETSTAAKCNYCAHRVDIGLEPACVNVCPEEAIVSGDMSNPNTKIAQLLSREQVSVRKSNKGTTPNLFYIDGDEASLNPTATDRSDSYFWSSQSRGVGHFAKAAEKMAFSNGDVVDALLEATAVEVDVNGKDGVKSIDLLMGKPKRVYDAPDKGTLWGWEVTAYVMTKAIATGTFLVLFLATMLSINNIEDNISNIAIVICLVFLAITGLLLIKDLDRPDRFLYVLFRPQWKSWLVKGAYAITGYGLLLTILFLANFFQWEMLSTMLLWPTMIFGIVTAIYTAFLFAQAKGRDFWQSPILSFHMLLHSLLAGSAVLSVVVFALNWDGLWPVFLRNTMIVALILNLFSMFIELYSTHPSQDAEATVKDILKGRYKQSFWFGAIIAGNLIPLLILFFGGSFSLSLVAAGILVMIGIYFTENIWVQAPQQIPLS